MSDACKHGRKQPERYWITRCPCCGFAINADGSCGRCHESNAEEVEVIPAEPARRRVAELEYAFRWATGCTEDEMDELLEQAATDRRLFASSPSSDGGERAD